MTEIILNILNYGAKHVNINYYWGSDDVKLKIISYSSRLSFKKLFAFHMIKRRDGGHMLQIRIIDTLSFWAVVLRDIDR